MGFKVILVDYGSDPEFTRDLKSIVANFSFIKLICCPASGQLWSKCRAINIVLKATQTPYFLVGDIDLIFHPDFIKIALEEASDEVMYFQYGFLSEKESLLKKKFEEFEIDFLGTEDVTGTTLFPTDKLSEVNGYDEFYHGWGAEDTDIHIRLRNLGLTIKFYNKSVLIKHQWHPKAYRSKNSTKPFHSMLERINSSYMVNTQRTKRTKVNLGTDWGKMTDPNEYLKLDMPPNHTLEIKPVDIHFSAVLAELKNYNNEVVEIKIKEANLKDKAIEGVKKSLGKKHYTFLEMETINNLLLEEIIKNYRNRPYKYNFDRSAKQIHLILVF
jgi:hypothetical protein